MIDEPLGRQDKTIEVQNVHYIFDRIRLSDLASGHHHGADFALQWIGNVAVTAGNFQFPGSLLRLRFASGSFLHVVGGCGKSDAIALLKNGFGITSLHLKWPGTIVMAFVVFDERNETLINPHGSNPIYGCPCGVIT